MRQFTIKWLDSGREPQCAPNPDYPNGKDVDVSGERRIACTVKLPYPARRIGAYIVRCGKCGFSIALTTAGRPDDPRSVKIPCKLN